MEDNGSICKITVDGTDFRIQEQAPFDRKWYSHKFKGPGLRYEVGVCIQTGWVVWINGPFPCGQWSDIKIARNCLVDLMSSDEMALADGGYRDRYDRFDTPNGLNNDDQYMKAVARARHEAINRRFKHFKVLQSTYRHPLEKHYSCFMAVANVTQMVFQEEGPVWRVTYNDHRRIGELVPR